MATFDLRVTAEQIERAADEFALKELGEKQYNTLPDARQAIKETFKEGVKWLGEYLTGQANKHFN